MITHWLLAARLKTLPVSVCPVILGIVMTQHLPNFNALVAGLTLFAALCIQLGTNFANDYYDHKKGADTERIGPERMTQSGQIEPNTMKMAAFTMFGLAFILGLYLIWYGGWPILVIGVLSIIFGIMYTAGPYALAYIGGAEVISYLFFGPISVMGTVYLQTFQWSQSAFFLGSGIGLITSALLVVNNTRDIDTDKKVNKRTWAVRFGRLFSYFEYMLFMYAPIFLLDYVIEESTEEMIALIGMVLIATIIIKKFRRAKDVQYNRLLFLTSLYLILYTALCIYFIG